MIDLRVPSPSDPTDKIIVLLAGDPGVADPGRFPGGAWNLMGTRSSAKCRVAPRDGATDPALRPSGGPTRLHRDRAGPAGHLRAVGRGRGPAPRRAATPGSARRSRPVSVPTGSTRPSLAPFPIIADHIGAVGILDELRDPLRRGDGPRSRIRGNHRASRSGLDRYCGEAVREGLSALTIGSWRPSWPRSPSPRGSVSSVREPTPFRVGIPTGHQPIQIPNVYSLVVAVLAGVVGIVG